jgi:hypothetical protein
LATRSSSDYYCSSWHSLLNSSLWNEHPSLYTEAMPSVCHCHPTSLSLTLPFCHSQCPFLNSIHQLFMWLLLDCLTLMMKTQWSFETLGSVYSVTQHNFPEDLSLQQHHCGDRKVTISPQVKLWECVTIPTMMRHFKQWSDITFVNSYNKTNKCTIAKIIFFYTCFVLTRFGSILSILAELLNINKAYIRTYLAGIMWYVLHSLLNQVDVFVLYGFSLMCL